MKTVQSSSLLRLRPDRKTAARSRKEWAVSTLSSYVKDPCAIIEGGPRKAGEVPGERHDSFEIWKAGRRKRRRDGPKMKGSFPTSSRKHIFESGMLELGSSRLVPAPPQTSLPNFTLSEVMLVSCYWLWWEYLHPREQEMLQSRSLSFGEPSLQDGSTFHLPPAVGSTNPAL